MVVNVRRWNVGCQRIAYIPIVQLHGGLRLNWLFEARIKNHEEDNSNWGL